MAKRHTKILTLTGKTCRLGKISNNLEKHGKEWETEFAIPITELTLTKGELNTFMRDKDCWASWYDTSKNSTTAAEPMPWWAGESFYVADTFEADEAMLTVSGDRDLKFESHGDPKEDSYRPAIVISKVVLTPCTGGMTELNCTIYVRPGIGQTNLKLQDHQHREVKLTVVRARVEERKTNAQPELPIGEGGTGSQTQTETKGETTDAESPTATH